MFSALGMGSRGGVRVHVLVSKMCLECLSKSRQGYYNQSITVSIAVVAMYYTKPGWLQA